MLACRSVGKLCICAQLCQSLGMDAVICTVPWARMTRLLIVSLQSNW